MGDWFVASWTSMFQVALSSVAFYVTVFFAVRLAGRRTVAQISAFDFVVTVAIGSLLASTIVSADPAYANGAVALVSLLGMQVAVAHLRQRYRAARRFLDFSPRVVWQDGDVRISRDLSGPQLTQEEVVSMLRQKGFFDPGCIRLVILEPNGKVSVVPSGTGDESPFTSGLR